MAAVTTRRIAVVTATRAEYGLLYPLLKALQADAAVELQLIVTGTHMSPLHGQTESTIVEDGFTIAARIDVPVGDDSAVGITKWLGAATTGFGDVYAWLKPDLVVLLGDRYEMLGAAQAAMIARVPIAHIHGGEATEGLIDEAIRHSITKMAQLHFVAADEFRRRVVQLGEQPERVWTVGAVGLDNIARLTLLEKPVLEADLGLTLRSPSFLVTYHPVTLRSDDSAMLMRTMLEVLDETGGTLVVTGVNADTGGSSMRYELRRFAAERPDRVVLRESLGTLRYLSAMKHCDAVVGNSSSGLLEAPAMGVVSINIGDRQRGRPRAPSVVQCDASADSIRAALRVALSPPQRELAKRRESPYGTPGAALRIAAVLREHPLAGIIVKRFRDIADVGLA